MGQKWSHFILCMTWRLTKLGREKIIFQYFVVLHFATQQIPYWPDEKKKKKKPKTTTTTTKNPWLNLAVKLCIWHNASLAVFCLDGTISSLVLNSLLSTEVLFDEILKLSLKLLQDSFVLQKVSIFNDFQPQSYKKPRYWKTVRK